MTQLYDDPAMGWFIQGYWTGGCINCGVWVHTPLDQDVVELDTHFEHYHGEHRVTWKHTGPSISGITGNGRRATAMARKGQKSP